MFDIEKFDYKMRVIEAHSHVFGQVDNILAGRDDIAVKFLSARRGPNDSPNKIGALSWTDGQYVYFDLKIAQAVLDGGGMTDLVSLKGANFHELGHILFTPRVKSDFYSRMEHRAVYEQCTEAAKLAFNVLEDSRLESLLTTLYPAMAGYFESMVYEFVLHHYGEGKPDLSQAEEGVMLHVLTCGRFYLPYEVRAAAALTNTTNGPEVHRIVTEYIGLRYPKDTSRGVGLVIELAKLLPNDASTAMAGGCGHGMAANEYNGGPASGNQIGEIDSVQQARASKAVHGWLDGEGDPTFGNPNGDDQGRGVSNDPTPTPPVFAEMQNAWDDLFSDPTFVDDVNRTREAIRIQLTGKGGATRGEVVSPKLTTPDPEVMAVANGVERVLRDLAIALEPELLFRQTQGKVDTRRFVMREPYELDFFKNSTESLEDEGSVEVVLAVDVSGSMSSNMKAASELLWIIKRSMDAISAPCTVLGFTDNNKLLYAAERQVYRGRVPIFPSFGSTVPTETMQEALRILSSSDAAHRALITITDGSWGQAAEPEQCIETLNALGVETTMLYLGWRSPVEDGDGSKLVPYDGDKHRHQNAYGIKSFDSVLHIFREFTERAMRGALANATA